MRAALLACVSIVVALVALSPSLRGVQAPQTTPARSENELRRDLVNALTSERWEDVIVNAKALIALNERDGQAWVNLGYALHSLGRVDEALEAHRRAAQLPAVAGIGAYNIACVYALRGDSDQSFAWLHKAMAAGGLDPRRVKEDDDLKSLRDDPRFKDFLADLIRDTAHDASAQRPTASVDDRREARLLFSSPTGSAGQIALDWGPVAWKAEYEDELSGTSLTERRWRFGKDFWTTWDSNLSVAFGDEHLSAGHYYVMLTRQKSGTLALVFIESQRLREVHADPFLAQTTRGGREIPLTSEPLLVSSERLELRFRPDPHDASKATLEVDFGPHHLTLPFTVDFGL